MLVNFLMYMLIECECNSLLHYVMYTKQSELMDVFLVPA